MARKKRPGARRPSGRLTSAAQREDAMSVAVEARERHSRRQLFRIAERALQRAGGESKSEDIGRLIRELAQTRESGSAIGIALQLGDISQAQFDALEAYEQNQDDYTKAMDYKRSRSASDFTGSGGYDSSDGTDPEYEAWCNRVIDKFKRIRHAILTCGDPLAGQAVGTWVDDNNRVAEMLGSLRIASNAIGRVL